MEKTEQQQARARFVRALLAWHGVSVDQLSAVLGVKRATVYKKLDGRRPFTTDDLLSIAEAFDVEPGLLLRPPVLAELGRKPPSAVSEFAWTRIGAGQRHLQAVA